MREPRLSAAERVSVVIVTFNSAEVVGDAIASIDRGAEVIIVDNASEDDIRERVAGLDVVFVRNDRNLGFGTGCNIGARRASRELLLFLNPDARLRAGALEMLVRAVDGLEHIAAFNPRIVTDSGKSFHRRHSRLLDRAANARLRRPLTRDCEVEMLSGAALLCRRAGFDAIGGFDENIFLFSEDDDLCVRFKQAGFGLGYVHDAVVEHAQGGSSSPTPGLVRFKAYHFMRAVRYTRHKHGLGFNRAYRRALAAVNWAIARVLGDRTRQAKFAGYLEALGEPAGAPARVRPD